MLFSSDYFLQITHSCICFTVSSLFIILLWNARFNVTVWLSKLLKCDKCPCLNAAEQYIEWFLKSYFTAEVIWFLNPMPMWMASHKVWGCSLPVHVYTNISLTYICTQACINLRVKFIKLLYTYTYMHIYIHIPTLTIELVFLTLINIGSNSYCCPV